MYNTRKINLIKRDIKIKENLFKKQPPYRMIICVKTIIYIEESKSQSSRGTSGTFKTNFLTNIKNEFLIVFKYYKKKKKKRYYLIYMNLESLIE